MLVANSISHVLFQEGAWVCPPKELKTHAGWVLEHLDLEYKAH